MKFELEVGDRVRTVEIRRAAAHLEVTIDGSSWMVDAAHLDPFTWSLLVRDGDGSHARSVEASVFPRHGTSGFDVHIDGMLVPVQLKGGLGRRTRDIDAPAGAGGTQRVVAPMPGKVVRVFVGRGDAVTARQPLVVVEAMKMENELRAMRDGRVRELLVSEGQSVEGGAPLVVVDYGS